MPVHGGEGVPTAHHFRYRAVELGHPPVEIGDDGGLRFDPGIERRDLRLRSADTLDPVAEVRGDQLAEDPQGVDGGDAGDEPNNRYG